MRLHRGRAAGGTRLTWTLAAVIPGAIAAILVMLAPDLQWFLPEALRHRKVEMALFGVGALHALARFAVGRMRPGDPTSVPLPQLVRGVDLAGEKALARGLAIVFATVGASFLATWLPHYVLWPWARDADTFATLARSWDAGIRPYRDIRGYNFPGAIYLHWLLGKACGWGRTWPLYAIDAAGLLVLGVMLAAWSRRRLGRCLPGLAAYLVYLTSYLNLDFETVAQRDGHASLCIVLGLLILEGWPGRASRVLSALLAAVALTIRPHVVLFLPALAAAVLEATGPRRSSDKVETRKLAEWLLLYGVFTAMAFSPLVFAGLADHFVRGLRTVAYGGPYSQATPATAVFELADQLARPGTWVVIAGLGLVLVTSREGARRPAVTWSMALVAALAYRPLHPVQHAYLAQPLTVVGSAALALPIAWLTTRSQVPAMLRVIGVLIVIVETSVGSPRFCDARAALAAIGSIARGEPLPPSSPPGGRAWFDPASGRWYAWEDYRRTLKHLRRTTGPTTLVANVLEEPPYPAINGPTGRLSPFRAESGICWMLLVAVDIEPEFAAALERATDVVVVWSPEEFRRPARLRLHRLAAVIRAHFRPEAQFGHIEVWRRADQRGG